eukprot:Selendium_serpulae@DN5818_c1_g3_i1.p1
MDGLMGVNESFVESVALLLSSFFDYFLSTELNYCPRSSLSLSADDQVLLTNELWVSQFYSFVFYSFEFIVSTNCLASEPPCLSINVKCKKTFKSVRPTRLPLLNRSIDASFGRSAIFFEGLAVRID